MSGTATWTITGESSDGTMVIINVTATLTAEGGIRVEYSLDDGSAPADLTGIYFDFFNDGGAVSQLGGGNNMNGYGDGFDVGYQQGDTGLKDGANTSGVVEFSAAQLAAFGFTTSGESLLEEFANTEIGFRATSTGDDGEGSLKIGGTGDYHGGDDDDDDFFPPWGQDISNVILVFDQTDGDTKPDPDGDGYYTVKIDSWPGGADDDLDSSIDDILAWLIANDPNVSADSDLLGVIIKGGTEDTNFYAFGDNDTNGTEPDDAPAGLGLSWVGSENPQPASAVDDSYDYEDVFGL
jgi:hypothetical protein